ncbi:hypothetical protein D3C81_2196050 [compost metagenome]
MDLEGTAQELQRAHFDAESFNFRPQRSDDAFGLGLVVAEYDTGTVVVLILAQGVDQLRCRGGLRQGSGQHVNALFVVSD